MTLPIGKYTPFNTWVHRIDPRAKIAVIVLMIASAFISFNNIFMDFTMLGLIFVISLFLLLSSKMSFSSFISSMKTMWIFILILLLIYAIMPVNNPTFGVLFSLGSWTVYWDSLLNSLKIILRLFVVLSLTMILTSTTKPLALTYSLEWYFTPLKIVKFPAAEVSMTISIALRFIPTLLEDTNRIIKSQESRGVDFSKGNIFKKIASLTSLIIPLFVSAFSRSEDLANAMECRCYDPNANRTRYRTMNWKFSDTFVLVIFNLLLAAYIVISVMNFNFYEVI